MSYPSIDAIKSLLVGKKVEPKLQPAEIDAIEERLQFQLPSFLKTLYVEVGNGGYGPGYGLIGVGAGFKSDYGDLFDTFHQVKLAMEYDKKDWPEHMLPFNEWGGLIFSCVDCKSLEISLLQDFRLHPQNISLADFMDYWVEGKGDELRNVQSFVKTRVKVRNPATGEFIDATSTGPPKSVNDVGEKQKTSPINDARS